MGRSFEERYDAFDTGSRKYSSHKVPKWRYRNYQLMELIEESQEEEYYGKLANDI